ncbi:Conserved_hypothetical protein [Hexamita inflata]|uniref:Uncharacterized protein n=1 Tax=Hexamita inflata TaxID=28002 RepID=A0ABP1GMK9_9EUKA
MYVLWWYDKFVFRYIFSIYSILRGVLIINQSLFFVNRINKYQHSTYEQQDDLLLLSQQLNVIKIKSIQKYKKIISYLHQQLEYMKNDRFIKVKIKINTDWLHSSQIIFVLFNYLANSQYHKEKLNLIMKLTSHVFTFAFALGDGVSTDFFVVLFECGEIFTGFGEFTFFHTFGNIPVDESTLGEHQVEVLVGTAPDFSDGGGVGDHEAGTLDLGEIASWDDSWWLIVDTDLETSWAPVDELDGTLGLDDGDGGVDVLWNDVTTIHHAASHVLTVAWIALDHHVSWFEDSVGDFSNGELFVVSLVRGDEWGIGAEWEVDTWIWDEVGLELGEIDVEGAIETEGSGHGGDHLTDDSVDVGVGASFDVEVSVADVVHGFVVDHEGAVGVFEHAVGSVDGVVGFDDGDGDVDRWVDDELELGLSAVVDGETFEKEGTETGTSTTTEGVIHHEALETRAIVSELSDTVENEVNDFLANGVVTTGVVVGSVFLTRNELFWVVDLAVGASTNFVDDGWFEIDKDGTWDVFTGTSLGEEGVEGVFRDTDGFVRWHLAVMVDTMFEAEQFPACVTDLDTGLTDVNVDYFSHLNCGKEVKRMLKIICSHIPNKYDYINSTRFQNFIDYNYLQKLHYQYTFGFKLLQQMSYYQFQNICHVIQSQQSLEIILDDFQNLSQLKRKYLLIFVACYQIIFPLYIDKIGITYLLHLRLQLQIF